MLSPRTLAVADFVTRYIPSWLAPVNWALLLFLLAVCGGPLLKPKYLSLVLNVLLWVSILFFLGSWNFHPSMSPVISVLGFIEWNWVIPQWEAKLNQ
jgi:Na+/H+ antiporter NhaB